MKVIKPKRRKHSCTQTWQGTPEKVFPLLCPVRETDWIPGWDPKLVVSDSGVMERGCLFVEPESPSDAVWVVTDYDPNRFVAMFRVAPGATVSHFAIRLAPAGAEATSAHVAYEHTALGEGGGKIVDDFTEEAFAGFMEHFQSAINHYLTTGEMISEDA